MGYFRNLAKKIEDKIYVNLDDSRSKFTTTNYAAISFSFFLFMNSDDLKYYLQNKCMAVLYQGVQTRGGAEKCLYVSIQNGHKFWKLLLKL